MATAQEQHDALVEAFTQTEQLLRELIGTLTDDPVSKQTYLDQGKPKHLLPVENLGRAIALLPKPTPDMVGQIEKCEPLISMTDQVSEMAKDCSRMAEPAEMPAAVRRSLQFSIMQQAGTIVGVFARSCKSVKESTRKWVLFALRSRYLLERQKKMRALRAEQDATDGPGGAAIDIPVYRLKHFEQKHGMSSDVSELVKQRVQDVVKSSSSGEEGTCPKIKMGALCSLWLRTFDRLIDIEQLMPEHIDQAEVEQLKTQLIEWGNWLLHK